MKDIENIDIVLEKVRELWLKCPSLRLGQLLSNICISNGYVMGDLHVEDMALLRIIESELKKFELNDKYTIEEMKSKFL